MIESRVPTDQCNADSLARLGVNRRVRSHSVADVKGHLACHDDDFSWFGGSSNKRQMRRKASHHENHDSRHHHTSTNSHRQCSIHSNQTQPINMPVAYITTNPVKRPASIGPRAI